MNWLRPVPSQESGAPSMATWHLARSRPSASSPAAGDAPATPVRHAQQRGLQGPWCPTTTAKCQGPPATGPRACASCGSSPRHQVRDLAEIPPKPDARASSRSSSRENASSGAKPRLRRVHAFALTAAWAARALSTPVDALLQYSRSGSGFRSPKVSVAREGGLCEESMLARRALSACRRAARM
eukprot:8820197-Pyramimonas_sp.AAC.2